MSSAIEPTESRILRLADDGVIPNGPQLRLWRS
jgi:hypothetical protein